MTINKPTAGAGLVNILVILGVLFFQSHLPPVVPLFFGLPLGEQQLANSWALIIPPIVALAFLGVNIFITQTTKDDFIKQVLLGLTLTTTALSTITVVKIILLVGQR